MNQKRLLLLIAGAMLFLLSCNLTNQLQENAEIYRYGETAIVELTQAVQALETEISLQSTQVAQITSEATNLKATQDSLQATQSALQTFADDMAALQAIQTAQASRPISFSTDFETDDLFSEYNDPNGLVESHFVDGSLHMTVHDKDTYFWTYPDIELPENLSIQVDTQYIDGDIETGAGIVCKYDYDTDYGIYFEITFDGFYVILKHSDNDWEFLQEFEMADNINSHDTNTIKAVCGATDYQFYINNQLVSSFSDTSQLGDETALYAYTYSHPNSVISFDNFYAEAIK